MMAYHYAWLIWASAFLAPWIILYLAFPGLRQKMWWASVITAPFAGTVGLRQVSPGALVAPGQLITTLVDDAEMKLDFTIPALYLGSVTRGTAIEARTAAYPAEVIKGTVTSVDSIINPVTRSITVPEN